MGALVTMEMHGWAEMGNKGRSERTRIRKTVIRMAKEITITNTLGVTILTLQQKGGRRRLLERRAKGRSGMPMKYNRSSPDEVKLQKRLHESDD